MLKNVKLFYAGGNAYETIFASLTVGIALFFAVFGTAKIVGLQRTSSAALFALLGLFIGIIVPALALSGMAFRVPRASKAMLLTGLFASLVILRVIL